MISIKFRFPAQLHVNTEWTQNNSPSEIVHFFE